jgi:hypothetical protein
LQRLEIIFLIFNKGTGLRFSVDAYLQLKARQVLI